MMYNKKSLNSTMQENEESHCKVCVKIYKKAMVAVVINIVIMIGLVIDSERNIQIAQEQEFRLRTANITEISCASFCYYTLDSEDGCCRNEKQACIEKKVCLQMKLNDCEEEINSISQVLYMCYALLALSLVLLIVFFAIKLKERNQQRDHLRGLLQGVEQEPDPPNIQQDEGQEWSEYVQTNKPDEICAICHEGLIMTRVAQLKCQHIFHAQCIKEWFGNRDTHICPICRQIN